MWGYEGEPKDMKGGPRIRRGARGYEGEPEDTKGSPRIRRGARGYEGEPEDTKGSPRLRRGARGYKGKVKEGVHEGREVKPHWDEVQQADDPMGIDLAAADVAERTRRR